MKEVNGVPGVPAGYPGYGFLPSERSVYTLGKMVKNTLDYLDEFVQDPDKILNEPFPLTHVFDPEVLQPGYEPMRHREMNLFTRLFDNVKESPQDFTSCEEVKVEPMVPIIDLTDDDETGVSFSYRLDPKDPDGNEGE